ncbi:MAG: glutamate formimidoyltransferase [Calditrichaeota bacterium]|nr:glutamate formimidoyltransferase [Calditrichota bacterium]
MSRIVECVPNFSEGRDLTIIDKITAEIQKINGVELLDVDPGEATNRTVVTIAGDPDAAVEAAFQAIKKASGLIDMTKQKGAHPRMGATDVCPFIPVSGISMDECVELANRLGKRVGDELGIPVYLYEYAASKPEWTNLANCRAGEFEGLKAREGIEKWTPDYGPFKFGKSGATAISAREFLIAWNINLNTKNTKLASKIANRLREKGYAKMKKPGVFARDENGSVVFIPGKFKGTKAVGWFIDEYNRAQISINITNHLVSPLHEIYDEACKLADEFGLRATGSELVGLVPLDAMVDAGKHFLKKQGVSTGVSEADLVNNAIMSLGLSEVSTFDPEDKIIEYRLRQPGILTSKTVTDFVEELASDSPAPGGGSVAALAGALGAGLASMVSISTYDKKGYTKHNTEMDQIAIKAQELKAKLVRLIDEDTEAFNLVMAAFGLPKKTDSEKAARDEAIAGANRGATLVPFEVVKLMPELAKLAKALALHGNTNMTSDAGVAGLSAVMAVKGAAYNVMINLQSLPDDEFSKNLRAETDQLLAEVGLIADEVREIVESKLWA